MTLTASPAVAALTVYDMVKSSDRYVTVTNVRLLEKSGGKSGHWKRPAPGEAKADGDAKPAKGTGKPGKRARVARKGGPKA